MIRSIFIFLSILLSTSVMADDFVTRFLKECIEIDRPVNNVNIGKAMLNKMASNTDDEELKNSFRELNSIRIITTENKKDSKYYFDMAKEIVFNEFTDFKEVVSVDERNSKINILLKKIDDKTQEMILLALDDDNKLTIITVSGNIDFDSISKLTGSLRSENPKQAGDNNETGNEN